MAGNRTGRGLFVSIFKNFIDSLRPHQIVGNKIGTDYLGNEYFEIPSDRSVGRRRRERWFTPKDNDAFDQELPAEWESWLRGRRLEPPTIEEIERNLAIIEIKKKNWAELEAKHSASKGRSTLIESNESGFQSFPKYDEYERVPGEKLK